MANDDNVINIRTGHPDRSSPTWQMVIRLISAEGIVEVVSVARDVMSEMLIPPFLQTGELSELNDEVAAVLARRAGFASN
jgi:hypothetical protein